ncbi:putative pentatricopeptide repeat-containing protein At1g64310 isoform X2 [Macadamia integrifolia]|uniref:putative pentatricopeptide repeat-containing protein At1g64310 isoform X2 n=1 Tax=Macadamia integrifolia TaxID=60698 RepID=UPI001C53278B|nr:putative pentatricopeptide repeat-containing protein At1g64310 isoform X2 [Macadamia integrifolia]
MRFLLPSLVFQLSQFYQPLLLTKQLHAVIIKYQLSFDPFYATRIIRFYALHGDLQTARIVFDSTTRRSVYLWNSMIRAYAQYHKFNHSFSLFKLMLGTQVKPDNFTFACIVRSCSENLDPSGLRMTHGQVIVSGLESDSVSSSALVSAYSKLCLIDEACKVFQGMSEPDLVLWNSIISGYGCCGLWEKGLELFSVMRKLGEKPDEYTLVGLISGLTDPSLLEIGRGIHCFCLKKGFNLNTHVGSALVSMYSRCCCLCSAQRVFSSLSQPDLVVLSALVAGYVQSGKCEEALLLFKEMTYLKDKKADSILIASVLAACARLAIVRPGREIHGYVLRHGLEVKVMVSSAIVDMYSKCGFVGLGLQVFETMSDKNVIAYNSTISALGSHGLAARAFLVFDEMLEDGLKPDESTFSALLGACCHAGHVKDGQELFRRMKDEFGIEAGTQHHVYMVKLLGMAGELGKAYDFIQSMPQIPDSGVWGALLSSCCIHGNLELGEIVARRLFEIEPDKTAYRVMLSNIYAYDGRWDDVKKLRNDMVETGLKKRPGLSWI